VNRIKARTSPFSVGPPAYEWATGALSGGVAAYDAESKSVLFAAPEADMALLALSSPLVYDCRLELPGGASVVLFQGQLSFSAGVTRTSTDAATMIGLSGIGDTVVVDGETSASPLPLSLSSALAACRDAAASASASEAAAAEAVSPAGLLAAAASLPSAQLYVFAQALFAAIAAQAPTSPPGPAPILWNDAGVPVYS
jgi:hypothetical protein